MVVSAPLSLSATETPTIGEVLSSATVCPPGTVSIGRVVDGHDRDKRDRGLAVVYAIVDDNLMMRFPATGLSPAELKRIASSAVS